MYTNEHFNDHSYSVRIRRRAWPIGNNERLKESNFLRGTIEQDLQDPITGGFTADNSN